MSIRSIIQDMRMSRPQRGIQDDSPATRTELCDGLSQSCWANMPQELLREVLLKIESSESAWPVRKSVVACAGVCRSWRVITKEIVKTPELSAKLTFPISVKQVFSTLHTPFSLFFFWLVFIPSSVFVVFLLIFVYIFYLKGCFVFDEFG